MDWLRDCIVCLFDAAVWDGGREGRIPLADMPALGQWMGLGWPAIPPVSYRVGCVTPVITLRGTGDAEWGDA